MKPQFIDRDFISTNKSPPFSSSAGIPGFALLRASQRFILQGLRLYGPSSACLASCHASFMLLRCFCYFSAFLPTLSGKPLSPLLSRSICLTTICSPCFYPGSTPCYGLVLYRKPSETSILVSPAGPTFTLARRLHFIYSRPCICWRCLRVPYLTHKCVFLPTTTNNFSISCSRGGLTSP